MNAFSILRFFALCLFLACGGCETSDETPAYNRGNLQKDYARDLDNAQFLQPAFSNGSVPIAGWEVGTHTNGVRPFSNPNALYGVPQSR